MNRKMLATIGALVIIALAVVGVGYGLWFEDLYVNGTVETGELDVQINLLHVKQWIKLFSQDAEGRFHWVGAAHEGSGLFTLKTHDNAGNLLTDCEAIISTENLADNEGNTMDDGSDTISITVNNAFPEYVCKVLFEVENTGNVPVHLTMPEPTVETPAWIRLADIPVCFQAGKIPPIHPEELEEGGWYMGEGCTPDPRTDLVVTQGLTPVDGGYTAKVKNNSATCDYMVGLASYQMFEPKDVSYASQYIYDYNVEWLGAGAEMEFFVQTPDCNTQLDAFFGPALWTLGDGDQYWEGLPGFPGDRKLDYMDTGGDWCDPRFQLHQGQTTKCGLLIHFNNKMYDAGLVDEGQEYTFNYLIHAYQWNEDDAAAAKWGN